MIVGDLLLSELVSVGEIDPIGRRFRPLREKFFFLLLLLYNKLIFNSKSFFFFSSCAHFRKDTLVQIVLVSEDESVQSTLSIHGLETETIEQIAPVQVIYQFFFFNIYKRSILQIPLEIFTQHWVKIQN